MDDLVALATIVLIDSPPLIGAALEQLLSAAGLSVIGDATTGEEGVGVAQKLRPDLVLLELILGGAMSGIETVQQLAVSVPNSRVLVLTATQEPELALEAMLAGANGYMLKDAPPEEIVRGVKESAAGKCVIAPAVAGRIFHRLRERETPATAASDSAAQAIRTQLTDREHEVFKRLASGKSNQEIGEELSVSTNTVKNHVASILEKLELDNRVQAAVQAVRSGIS
jgi:NarL family two-component system response regulator LiaR